MSDSTPAAGWYPDPQDPGRHRYWDGTQWTGHVFPAPFPEPAAPSTPGTPVGGPTPPAGAGGTYGTYTPATAELAPSGMRRLPALFSDIGRILSRGWWPLLGVGLALWSAWLVVTLALASLVVDVRRLNEGFTLLADATNRYPNGRWPAATEEQIGEAFRAAVRFDTPMPYVLVGGAVLLLTLAVTAAHTAAITRISMEAASGRTGLWRAAWASAWTGGRRLFGYLLALMILGTAAVAAIVGPMVAFSPAQEAWYGALLGFFLVTLIGVVLSVWLTGRLVPVLAQVNVSRGAVRWSWAATRSKFWAVLGRWVLWALIASVLGQVLSSLVAAPFSLAVVALSANQGAVDLFWFGALYLVGVPLTMAVSALTYIGVVPIWRDLTDVPEYRAIDPDGHVVAPPG